MGRKRKYDTPESMDEKINSFFDECDEKDKPYTVTGLANALGFTRAALFKYKQEKGYDQVIKRALSRCEQYLEERLLTQDRNVAGIIFCLKNNYQWRDNQGIEVTGKDGEKLFPTKITVRLVESSNERKTT